MSKENRHFQLVVDCQQLQRLLKRNSPVDGLSDYRIRQALPYARKLVSAIVSYWHAGKTLCIVSEDKFFDAYNATGFFDLEPALVVFYTMLSSHQDFIEKNITVDYVLIMLIQNLNDCEAYLQRCGSVIDIATWKSEKHKAAMIEICDDAIGSKSVLIEAKALLDPHEDANKPKKSWYSYYCCCWSAAEHDEQEPVFEAFINDGVTPKHPGIN